MKSKNFLFLILFTTRLFASNFFEELSVSKNSAKSIGMVASLASDDIVNSIFNNPSNMAYDKNLISVFYSSVLDGILNNLSLSFLYKTPKNSNFYKTTKIHNLGICVFYNDIDLLDTTNLEFYDINQNGIKDVGEEIIYQEENLLKTNNSNLVVCLSIARPLKNLCVGGSIKYMFSKINNISANVTTLDISFSYFLKNYLSFSFKVNNLVNTSAVWSTGYKESINLSFEGGVNYTYKFNRTTNIKIGLDIGNTSNGYFSMGGELSYLSKYFLRGGFSKVSISQEHPTEFLSFGVGAILKENIFIDYAIKIINSLNEKNHFVSLGYNF
ncbi:MAG: hypothetical protein RMJ67_01010 [Elusimicrobiota bacterium]|nr:hypothetical protein [Endomicrobiia bacterium]MDW8165082.1 hypothetical protein [Elusimicrobiota bacterium]